MGPSDLMVIWPSRCLLVLTDVSMGRVIFKTDNKNVMVDFVAKKWPQGQWDLSVGSRYPTLRIRESDYRDLGFVTNVL